jgi:phosphatidylglycerol lysyltransferase
MTRRWIFWLLVVAFLWLLVSRFGQVEKLAQTLAGGRWEWVLAALGLQFVYYLIYSALYHSAFHTVEVDSRLRDLIPLVFASIFVNTAAPIGGASGAALFIDDAAHRGQPAARAAAGTVLVVAADFLAFAAVLVVGSAYLLTHHDLQLYEILGTVALLVMVLAVCGPLALGLWRPEWLRHLLDAVQRLVAAMARRLRRSSPLAEDWAGRNAQGFSDAAFSIRAHPARLARTLGVALAGHAVDLATLQALFLAFYQPLGLGPLVAGYAVGILFWIVSPTPQGIGVVEGVMALAFTSLDVPGSVATVVTLSFRGLSFWIPLLLGFVLLRRLRTFRVERRAQVESAGVRLVALLAGLMGVVNILSAVTPSLASRVALLEEFVPLAVRRGGHLTAALAGLALLLVAGNLARRKRVAWWLAEAALLASIASHLLKGLDYEEASLAAGLALWLFLLRHRFHAASDRPTFLQGLRLLLIAPAFTLLYGVTGFYLLDRHFSVNFSLMAAARQTVVMFTQFYDPGLIPLTRFGHFFADSIYWIAAFLFGIALVMLLRPVILRQPATPEQRARARAIVEAHGRSSLARLTLMDDKAYCFSPGGSVVAYVARGRAAVALGDPIGPPGDIPSAIRGFVELARRDDWAPAFYQTLPEHLPHYQDAGLSALCIGQEAVVRLASFSTEGKAGKSFRSASNRLTRLGYRARLFPPPLADGLLAELRLISDEWLTMMHGTEKHFSLGWFDEAYLRDGPLMTVQSPEGRVVAFANVVSEYRKDEVTIDLMRHRREIEPGTMDFLFLALLEWAREQGCDTFNLGLSSLAGVGERTSDPAVERAMHFVYEHIDQFYDFKGLHAFKAKFQPEWSPRYLIYPSAATLPAILAALLRADSGDGLLASFFRR